MIIDAVLAREQHGAGCSQGDYALHLAAKGVSGCALRVAHVHAGTPFALWLYAQTCSIGNRTRVARIIRRRQEDDNNNTNNNDNDDNNDAHERTSKQHVRNTNTDMRSFATRTVYLQRTEREPSSTRGARWRIAA
jgi:hypothetical protein